MSEAEQCAADILDAIKQIHRENPQFDCPHCLGTGWVCENHTDKAWYGFISDQHVENPDPSVCYCGGAGMRCRCCPDAGSC